jgi:hypothetical protein
MLLSGNFAVFCALKFSTLDKHKLEAFSSASATGHGAIQSQDVL